MIWEIIRSFGKLLYDLESVKKTAGKLNKLEFSKFVNVTHFLREILLKLTKKETYRNRGK